MANLYEAQKVHRQWLRAAGGDLNIVEQALIDVTRNAERGGHSATSDDVMKAIKERRQTAPEAKSTRAVA